MSFSLRTCVLAGVAAILLVSVALVYSLGRSSDDDASAGTAGSSSSAIPAPTVKNIPALGTMLQNSDATIAVAAAERLSQARSPEAVAPLLAAVNDPRPPVQAAAINALVALQPTTVDPAPFMAIVESGAEPSVRAAALNFLGAQKVVKAMPMMLKCAADPDTDVRDRAAYGLHRITGRDYHFRADDSPARRKEILAKMHDTITFPSGAEGPKP